MVGDQYRVERMKPENAAAFRELQLEIKNHEKEQEERSLYKWLEDANDIIFWDYRNSNPDIIRAFERREDLTDWDKFAAKLDLSYTDIEHCRLFNDRCPTREVFRVLMASGKHQHLSLRQVLDILVELGHHDILLDIPWQSGLEKVKYKKVCKPPQENKGRSSPSPCSKNSKSSLNVKIMMIYAQDARTDALNVAKELNQLVVENMRVRPLLLTEPTDAVAQCLMVDPFNSIQKWFNQVDFVVPVLSPQFLRQIQNLECGSSEGGEYRSYNRFVYRNLLDQYVNNGSRNTRCRPLCPTRYFSQVMQNKLVQGNGLLQVLWNLSNIEEFVKILIRECRARLR